jgi:hypothetical protein
VTEWQADATAAADGYAGNNAVGDAVAPCPLRAHWVEIQLIGEDGAPIGGVRYRIEPPTGPGREGVLDGDGSGGYYEISAGTCKVSFPDLDMDAWQPVPIPPP